ncbi:MAG: hypothetical protein ABSF59_04030 [Candidatus Sulfotelmatobacter sp.]|jgi:hypothetical protein
MLTFKLVHLIQYHSDTLASSLIGQVQLSERAGSYDKVSPEELKERVHEIYHHLGAWLLDKSETDVEERYRAIGARRAEQGVPLSELVWVIVLTKHNLSRFIEDVSVPGRAVEASEKHELVRLLDQFFDQAIHAAVVGYESARQDVLLVPKAEEKTVHNGLNKSRKPAEQALRERAGLAG